MGIFGKSKKAPAWPVHELRRGTTIPMVDVDSTWVSEVRAAHPDSPRASHEVPVLVGLNGNDIAVYYDGKQVARMNPEMAQLYLREFQLLARLKRMGKTVALVRPEHVKTPHALSLNWSSNAAYDGGIVGEISLGV